MLSIKEVSKVLFDVWDPLNVKGYFDAPDEYDDWAREMLVVLESGVDEDTIERALMRILVDEGMSPEWPGNGNRQAARALVALRASKEQS